MSDGTVLLFIIGILLVAVLLTILRMRCSSCKSWFALSHLCVSSESGTGHVFHSRHCRKCGLLEQKDHWWMRWSSG